MKPKANKNANASRNEAEPQSSELLAELAKIRNKGEQQALIDFIESHIRAIEHEAFSDRSRCYIYRGLGQKITKLQQRLQDMQVALQELQKLNPEHT